MVIILGGTLGYGDLFGSHKLDAALRAEVGVADNYWLIYARVPPEGNAPIDIGKLLNTAFDLGLDKLSILVNDAGFFQLSAAQGVPFEEIMANFPAVVFPDDPTLRTQILQRFTCFWAEIEFANWDIGNSIVQIGGNKQNMLKLYGCFASGDDVSTTIYIASFPDFSLFNTFAFSGIQIQYTFNETALYKLKGTLTILAFGQRFIFNGLVSKEPTRFFAALAVSIGSAGSVSNPFGTDTMPGVTYLKLQFALLRQTPPPAGGVTSLSWFQGSVDYAPLSITGSIYLEDTTPVLAFLGLQKDLDIGAIFTNSITAFKWPSELINIVFKAGSSIYYCKVGYDKSKLEKTGLFLLDDNGNAVPVSNPPGTYLDGFNVYANIDLTIWKTISFNGNINIGKQGVSATIQLNDAIDLFVLQIVAPPNSTGNGPQFKLDSRPSDGSAPYVQLNCGLLFFQANFGLNTSVKISRGQATGEIAVQATLSTTQSYAVLGGAPVSLAFSYSKSQGFRIDNWPNFTQAYDSIKEIIDIGKEASALMRKADPNLVCGAISQLISEVAYKNSFTMSPTFDTVSSGGTDTLYFVLNGKFQVFVLDQLVTTINFPNTLRIPLPSSISFDTLGDAIANAIKDSAESFVASLINNGEQWGKLAGILFAQQATALAAQMLCEGLIDGITAQALAAAGSAVTAAGGAGAAGAVAAGAAAAASIFSSCFTAGTEVALYNGSCKRIEDIRIGDVLKGHNGLANEVLAYDHPKLGSRKLYAFNDGPFFVTAEHPFLTEDGWKAIDPSATLQENPNLRVTALQVGDRLLLEDGSKLELQQISSTGADAGTQLYNFKLSGNNTYIANGLVAHNKGSSCFVAGTEVLLADGSLKTIENVQIGDRIAGKDGAVNTVLAFDHPLLGDRSLFAINDGMFFVTAEHPFYTTEGWKAIDPAATAWENSQLPVSSLKPGDILVLSSGDSIVLTALSETTADPGIQLYNFVLDGNNTYFANGFLVHNKGGGGGGNPDPQQPTFASPPLTFSGQTLTASWNGASYATGYQVEFYDPSGAKIGNTHGVGLDTTQFSTNISLNFNGGSYSSKINSVRGDKQSAWSSAQIPKVPNAAHILLSYDAQSDQLVATWDTVSQASNYSVTLLLNGTGQNTQTPNQPKVTYHADALAAGTYNVQVVSQAASAVPGAPVSGGQPILKPAAPLNVTMAAQGQQFVVSWTAVQGTNYTVQLIRDGVVVQQATSNSGNQPFVESGTGAYTAQVRVTGASNQLPGAWATTGQPISKLPRPENVLFTYDTVQQQLCVSWDAVTGNNGYSIQVFGKTDQQTVYTGTAPLNAVLLHIPVAAFTAPAGMYGVRVRAEGGSGTVDSDYAPSADYLQRIAAPDSAALTYDSALQQLQISWTGVTGNDGYHLVLFNEHSPDVPVADVPALKDSTTALLATGQLQLLPGMYQIRVSTTGSANTITSLATASLTGVAKPGTPQLQTVQFAHNLVTASWTSVTGATTYTFALAGTSSKTSTGADTGTTVVVSELAKGTYDASVAAAITGGLPGDQSKPLPVTITPLSLNDLALQFFTEGAAATDAGKGILLAFPDTDYLVFTAAFAKAGYPATETAAALREYFPGLTAQQVAAALQAAYGTMTAGELAKQSKAQGMSAIQTGQQLVSSFPGISANDFAIALAGAPYPATDTAGALKQSFPGLTAQQVAAALQAAYGTITAGELAKQSKAQGMSAIQTGQQLVSSFPGISANDFAIALAGAPYPATDTAGALKQSFPGLTAQQVAVALQAAYGTITAGELAKQSKAQGMSAVQTGQQLVSSFPGISANDFAIALAGAPYPITETAGAMKASLPGLPAQQVAAALQAAYN